MTESSSAGAASFVAEPVFECRQDSSPFGEPMCAPSRALAAHPVQSEPFWPAPQAIARNARNAREDVRSKPSLTSLFRCLGSLLPYS